MECGRLFRRIKKTIYSFEEFQSYWNDVRIKTYKQNLIVCGP